MFFSRANGNYNRVNIKNSHATEKNNRVNIKNNRVKEKYIRANIKNNRVNIKNIRTNKKYIHPNIFFLNTIILRNYVINSLQMASNFNKRHPVNNQDLPIR